MLQIIVNLPKKCDISMEKLASFSPNENLMMLMVGIQAIDIMKKNYINEENGTYDDFLRNELSKKEDDINRLKIIYDNLLIDEKARQVILFDEQIVLEKERLSITYKDLIEKNDTKNNKYQEQIDYLNDVNNTSKTKIMELEIEQAKKNERDMLRDLHLDIEINIKMKDKEDEKNKEIDELKEKNYLLEKDFLVTENNLKVQEHLKIEKLNIELSVTKKELSDFLINQEREKNILLNESLEKSLLENTKINTNKSNSRGVFGESYMKDIITKTFQSFEHFELTDKSKIPHAGDMWLEINGLLLMLDVKNYNNFVPKSEIEKLKRDMDVNPSIKIAWLVSLETKISNFGHAPYVIEIIQNKIYCYINELILLNDPVKLLTTAYYQCKFLYDKIINVKDEGNLIEDYERNEKKVRTTIQKMLDNSRSRYATLENLKGHFSDIDNDLKNCLNDEFKVFEQKNLDIVQIWWSQNTIKDHTTTTSKLDTNDVYKRFILCEENKNSGIDNDMMKKILKDSLNEDEVVMGGKTSKSRLWIIGYNYNVV
jgi:hypothetical protein